MANEFKVKNGLIVIGELTTSGTITINGALAATQSWVTSQAYLTSSSLTSYATQSYVTSAIASLVDSAPGALDTLRELATALGNDASFSTTVTNSIAAKQNASTAINTSNIASQSVSYANSAGSAGYVTNQSGQLASYDNRTISPSETNASYLQFGFTSWGNNNSAPYADYLHLRSYPDSSGGSDNLVMFLKSGIGMRIYQQTFGSASAYSSYADVWHSGNLTNLNQLTNGPGYITSYTEVDTLATVTGRGATTSTNISVNTINIGTDATYGGAYRSVSFGYNGDGSNRIFAANNTSDGMYFAAATGQGFNFRPNGGTANLVVINSAGNVGIGTTTPQKKLDVFGSAGILASFGSNISPGQFAGLHFGYSESYLNNDSYKKSALVFERTDAYTGQGGNAGGKIHFLLNNSSSTSANALTDSVVTIDSDANGTAGSVRMGIGTRNPSTPLHVIGIIQVEGGGSTTFYGTDGSGSYARNFGTQLYTFRDAGGSIITTINTTSGVITTTGGNSTQWNTAYSWGNHATAGYAAASSLSNYLPLTGGTLTGALSGTSATFSGDLLTSTSGTSISNTVQFASGNVTGQIRGQFVLQNPAGTSVNANDAYIWRIAAVGGVGNSGSYNSNLNFLRTTRNGVTDESVLSLNGYTGNIGIGTTSPTQKLEVGNFLDAVTNRITVASRYEYEPEFNFRLGQSGTNYDWVGAVISSGDDGNYNGKILFKTAVANREAPTTKMAIKANGNVGIGTTSPLNKLDVSGGVGDGATYDSIISLSRTSSTGNVEVAKIVLDDFDTNHANLVFRVKTTASSAESPGYYTDALTIKGTNGNLGIGTTSPANSLEVQGAANTSIQAIFQSSSSGNAAYNGGIQLGNAGSNQKSSIVHTSAGDNTLTFTSHYSSGSANKFIFAPGGTETVRFQQNGNVGIGTTDPTSQMSGTFGIGIYNALYPAVGFKNSTTAWLWYGQDSTFRMWNVTFGDILTANTSGNIGIGTTSPSTKLDVNGVISATGGNSTNWNTAYSWGNHASGGYLRLNTWEGNSYIGTSGAHYGTVFYDSNDTSYYADPSSTSNLNNLSVVGYQYIGGQTSNGQSNYQWDGATYRNPDQWTARLILRRDNATTGINGSIPSLVIFNNNGADQTTASMVFATNECVTGSNSVNLAGIIAKKESVGNCGGWSAGSLNFFVKNYGARVDSLALTSDGNATFSGIVYSTGYGNSSQWNTAYGWGNHASASYATTSYVTTQINNLIAGAPGALDTLDELAAALGDDSNFATTVTNSIAAKLPLAGGNMTGAIIMSGTQQIKNAGYSGIEYYNAGAQWQAYIGTENNTGNLRYNSYSGSHTWYANSVQKMALDLSGNLTISGFLTESSSLKLKENVETSGGNLEKVVNLRPVTYNKIGSQTTELGLIAEEVATVYPEFVQYDESGEPVGVNYSRLTAALIGAVKELTQRIETLENNG